MKRFQLLSLFGLLALAILVHSRKKETGAVSAPPEQAHFSNKSSGNYVLSNPVQSFKIPIGLTTVSNTERTVTITVTSPDGAVEGTDYTLNKKTFVFPAGQVTDTLIVTADITKFPAGRKDTVIFDIVSPGVTSSDYNAEFLLTIGQCSEFTDAVNLTELLGDYTNTVETFGTGAPYGPYPTKITAVNQTSATTGEIKVFNLWDAGAGSEWQDITFTVDWSNLTNKTVTVVEQNTGIGDAGSLSSTYAGYDVAVRPFAGRVGSLEFCTQKIVLKLQLGVANGGTPLGFFSGLYTVTMQR